MKRGFSALACFPPIHWVLFCLSKTLILVVFLFNHYCFLGLAQSAHTALCYVDCESEILMYRDLEKLLPCVFVA